MTMQTPRPEMEMDKVWDLPDEAVQPLALKTVLMLEDNAELAATLKTFLKEHFYQVVHVTNGADGVRQLLARDFDVILCDLVMPNLPGDMFYKAVENTKPHLCKRFVFMTGHGSDSKWRRFSRDARRTMLLKPFPLPALIEAIEVALAAP
jgi:CheY-like chemotaxis protein